MNVSSVSLSRNRKFSMHYNCISCFTASNNLLRDCFLFPGLACGRSRQGCPFIFWSIQILQWRLLHLSIFLSWRRERRATNRHMDREAQCWGEEFILAKSLNFTILLYVEISMCRVLPLQYKGNLFFIQLNSLIFPHWT